MLDFMFTQWLNLRHTNSVLCPILIYRCLIRIYYLFEFGCSSTLVKVDLVLRIWLGCFGQLTQTSSLCWMNGCSPACRAGWICPFCSSGLWKAEAHLFIKSVSYKRRNFIRKKKKEKGKRNRMQMITPSSPCQPAVVQLLPCTDSPTSVCVRKQKKGIFLLFFLICRNLKYLDKITLCFWGEFPQFIFLC